MKLKDTVLSLTEEVKELRRENDMLKTKSIEVASSVQSHEHQPTDHISSVSYARKVSHMHGYMI